MKVRDGRSSSFEGRCFVLVLPSTYVQRQKKGSRRVLGEDAVAGGGGRRCGHLQLQRRRRRWALLRQFRLHAPRYVRSRVLPQMILPIESFAAFGADVPLLT